MFDIQHGDILTDVRNTSRAKHDLFEQCQAGVNQLTHVVLSHFPIVYVQSYGISTPPLWKNEMAPFI